MNRTTKKLTSSLIGLALLGTACGGDDSSSAAPSATTAPISATTEHMTGDSPSTGTGAAGLTSTDTGAATLRAGLTGLLTEHVYLTALATGSALRGDTKGFDAYAASLNGPTNSNTADLVTAIGGAYGPEVGKAFEGLWRSDGHIPAVVAYTQAVAAGDQAKADQAVTNMMGYAKTFGATMHQVNENLSAADVEKGLVMHITTLKAIIDAQKAGDQPKVYASVRAAYAHMNELAELLAVATATKFPAKFDGDAASAAADLRAGMTALLREHVLLASSATGAALAGRQPQFEAAAGALNGATNSNTADIVAAIGSVYGPEVGKAFDGLWRSDGHIPSFVAYTQAVAANDKPKADAAIQTLRGYAKTFGATMNQVNPNLPAAAVEEAITMHATTLLAVIDAQKGGDPALTATRLRQAVGHMSGTADVLAAASVSRFPDKFQS